VRLQNLVAPAAAAAGDARDMVNIMMLMLLILNMKTRIIAIIITIIITTTIIITITANRLGKPSLCRGCGCGRAAVACASTACASRDVSFVTRANKNVVCSTACALAALAATSNPKLQTSNPKPQPPIVMMLVKVIVWGKVR